MTGWNIVNNIIQLFPPVAAGALLVTAAIIFIIGFSRRGLHFIKYGFGQTMLDDSLEKRFDDLAAGLDSKIESKIESLATRLDDKIESLAASVDDKIKALAADVDDKINSLAATMATKDDIAVLDAKIAAIEVNHFGHLKNYLGILNGVLLDRNIIDNETRARLDNELRGM